MSLSSHIPETEISFSILRSCYKSSGLTNAVGHDEIMNDAGTQLKLSDFGDSTLTDNSSVEDGGGTINIGTNFKGKFFGITPEAKISDSTDSNGSRSPNVINIWYRRSVIKFNYDKDALKTAAHITADTLIIGKIRFHITNALEASYTPLPNYKVCMKHNGTDLTTNPGTSGWTTVRYANDFSPSTTGYYDLVFDSPFVWITNQNLAFSFSWGRCPTGYSQDGQTFTFSDTSKGRMWYRWTDSKGTFTEASPANNSLNTAIPIIEISNSMWRKISDSTDTNTKRQPNIINIYYRRSVIKFNYNKDTLKNISGITSDTTINIWQLRFYVTNALATPYMPLPSYKICMKNNGTDISSNPGTTGWTVVRNSGSFSPATSGYYEILFDNPFAWDTSKNIAFSFSWGRCPTGWTPDGQSYTFNNETDGNMFYRWTDSPGVHTQASPTPKTNNSIVPLIELYF